MTESEITDILWSCTQISKIINFVITNRYVYVNDMRNSEECLLLTYFHADIRIGFVNKMHFGSSCRATCACIKDVELLYYYAQHIVLMKIFSYYKVIS